MPRRDLLVELFVEELPPKALKTARRGLRRRRWPTAWRSAAWSPPASVADAVRLAAPPGALHLTERARAAPPTQDGRRQADAGRGRRSTPTARRRRRCASACKLGARPRRALAGDARAVEDGADRLERRRRRQGRGAVPATAGARASRSPAGLQAALDDALAGLPIPKVMQYQLADGWTSVDFVRPAHGLVALHGSDVVPVRALGLDGRPHRRTAIASRPRGRRSSCATPTATREQLRDEGAVIAGFAERRAEIVRQLARRGRGRTGLRADRRRRPCSTR